MKICSACKTEKHIHAFSKRGSGFQSTCKECHAEYRKNHYKNNKKKYIEKASRWRLEQKIQFYTWLQSKKCIECELQDYRVLEFHHVDDTKEYEISQKIGCIKFESLLKEIEKCDILCANCHRIKTVEQLDHYKYMRV